MPVSPKWIAPLAIAVAMAVPHAASAAAPVSVGHSGWFWGNPLPQGNALADAAFAGSRGYAVGNAGTVLRTDDGGATWSGLGAGTAGDLNVVSTFGPNTVFAGGGCTLRRSDDAGGTFRRLPVTASDARCPSFVSAVSFASPTLGYVLLANGTVLRTADGGRSFGQRTSVPGGASTGGASGNATDVDFVTADVGVAVAGGRVYRTANGGGSWTAVPSAAANVTRVAFTDAAHATAVGGGGTFLTSDDGGATFTARPLTGAGAGKQLTGVSCGDPQTCVATLGTGQLVRTSDGGATSTLVAASDQSVYAARFAGAGRVVGVGEGGATVVSGDAGASFQSVGTRLTTRFGDIRPASGARAYALGDNGRIARTLDGGRTWSAFGAPTGDAVADVSFPTPAVGYALDDGGSLLRTENAGDSWQILDAGVSGTARAVIATSPDRVAVIGPRGVRRSTNGGKSFGASKSKAVRRAKLSRVDQAGRSIVAYGARTLVRSSNGGGSWTKLRKPRGAIRVADFVSSRRGYVVTSGGRVYATANGGRRWRWLTGVGQPVETIAFGDARHGFARRDGSSLLRTDDGGRTWEPQLVSNVGLVGLAATSRGIGFASDINGSLYGTASGGRLATGSTLTLKVSKRRLTKRGSVQVRGKLRPASPGSTVTIIQRRGSKYASKDVVVASTGAFSATFGVRGSSEFIAQWRGDDRLDGDGTAPLKVTVKRRR